MNECIKIQTGGQDESLSTSVPGKDTELHANSTVSSGSFCLNLSLFQQWSKF